MTNPIIEFLKSNIGGRMGEGSPSLVAKWLDGELVAAEYGSLTFRFEVKPEFTNPAMILHGGVSAAMMDEVLGATVYSLDKGAFYATVNLNVDYLRPAKVGEKVLATSEIIKEGKTLIHAACTLTNEAGEIVAKCVSNLARTSFATK